jgi:hypothetical protein
MFVVQALACLPHRLRPSCELPHGCAIVMRKHLCDKAILVSQKLWHAVNFLACIFRRAALGGTAGALVGRSGLPEAWKVDGQIASSPRSGGCHWPTGHGILQRRRNWRELHVHFTARNAPPRCVSTEPTRDQSLAKNAHPCELPRPRRLPLDRKARLAY